MSVSVQPRGDRFQLRVKHPLLPKPFFSTFDTEPEARSYGTQLAALLARGIVPQELIAEPPKGGADPLLVEVIRAYTKGAPLTDSDDALLTVMLAELVGVRISGLTYQWADSYVHRLKLKHNLAPGTIRKRIGALGRVVDWHLRRATPPGQMPPSNALRLLPRGYSLYSREDALQVDQANATKRIGDNAKRVKRDESRDVRLAPEAEARIEAALAGQKRADRERALVVDPAFSMMFRLILDTGMRLRETYRLRVDQVDLTKRLINVEGSKGHRGQIKPRHVPLKPALAELLQDYCRDRVGLMFPFWDGDASLKALNNVSSKLSQRFATLFAYADVPDLTEHDLRHEATCRWVELRSSRGGWVFSDVEICRIMGWSDMNMMLRYASLRGEDLAARMA